VSRPEILLGNLDAHALHRFTDLAVDDLGEHLGLADGQLEALAPHHLDEHRQRQLASALHLEGVGSPGRKDADRDVAECLVFEACLQLASGELGSVAACEW
jgi:hypothetical protein